MFTIGSRVRVLRPYCLQGECGWVRWTGRHMHTKVFCLSVSLDILDRQQSQRCFLFTPDQLVRENAPVETGLVVA